MDWDCTLNSEEGAFWLLYGLGVLQMNQGGEGIFGEEAKAVQSERMGSSDSRNC
jgi:hypothetical protein